MSIKFEEIREEKKLPTRKEKKKKKTLRLRT